MTKIAAPRPSLSHRASRWFARNLIRIYAGVAFFYLFIPVAYTFAQSRTGGGMPTQINIQLTFRELQILTKELVEEGL